MIDPEGDGPCRTGSGKGDDWGVPVCCSDGCRDRLRQESPAPGTGKPGQAVAAPGNLAAVLTGGQVLLTWTHEMDLDHAVLPPKYFEISMAVPEDCEGCPFVFRQVGQTHMPDMVFRMPAPESGVRYFRVQAVGDYDVRSDYSQTAMVGVQ